MTAGVATVGYTHAESVPSALFTAVVVVLTKLLVPLKVSEPDPTLPADHVGELTKIPSAPPLPVSAAVVPVPSSNSQW